MTHSELRKMAEEQSDGSPILEWWSTHSELSGKLEADDGLGTKSYLRAR